MVGEQVMRGRKRSVVEIGESAGGPVALRMRCAGRDRACKRAFVFAESGEMVGKRARRAVHPIFMEDSDGIL